MGMSRRDHGDGMGPIDYCFGADPSRLLIKLEEESLLMNSQPGGTKLQGKRLFLSL
jgi:hypothetical protein